MTLERDIRSQTWHSMTEEAVYHKVASGDLGLEQVEATHRLERFGPNVLITRAEETLLSVVLHQLRHPLIYLLLGAALISMLAGHMIDAVVIGGVVALNTVLGAFQEMKAGRAMDALRKMAAPHSRVLRDEALIEIPAEDVVPGDVLVLETGDRVAADARVIQSTELRANESALTGESEPVAKHAAAMDANTSMADQRNMVWMSTAVTSGRGRAVVVATGMDTSLGRIAGQVQQSGGEDTPLQRRLSRLSAMLGLAGIVLSGVVFLLGLLRGHGMLDMVFYALATAVSAIPEGLPAVISVTLALGVQRMSRRHAIIRRLPAVETLGSTTVICSDKTGTITRNEMTVTRLWFLNHAHIISGDGFDREDDTGGDGGVPDTALDVQQLLRIGMLNNNAYLTYTDKGVLQVNGTPTEGALLVAAHKAGLDSRDAHEQYPRLAEIPFASEHKYMATLHRHASEPGVVAYVKGAPDRILSFCSHVMINGQSVPLRDADREKIAEALQHYAAQALRMVAAAYKSLPEQPPALAREDVEQGLTFAGLWGIVDPPRPEAIEAIQATREAGIRVVMITGDHAVTASAIARDVGIAGDAPEVITGAALDTMDEAELRTRLGRVNVFARVSPEHKLRILRALKANGEVVAMTGDGVNDAPALKGADIGVAMGKAGTEVAREASDMVLTDDNFATIVHAVEEGRVIFANLQRVVFFLITTNLGEVLTLTVALLIGLPLPLTAIMILWINLVTDGVCTIPLGIEPKHWDVLKQPPRAPGSGVIDTATLRRMLVLASVMAAGTIGLFIYELYAGSELHAQTVAFTTLAAFQWFQALSARTFKVSMFSVGVFSNLWLWAGIAAAIMLQVLLVHTPVGQALFGVEPLTLFDWVLITTVASSIFIADEIMKRLGIHG